MRRNRCLRMVVCLSIVGAFASAPISTAPPNANPGAAPGVVEYPERIAGEPVAQMRPEPISAATWGKMLKSIEAERYVVRPLGVASGAARYQAFNPAHGLLATFAEDGVRVKPGRDGESPWEWSLRLEKFGYEGDLEPAEAAAPIAEGNRVEYRRGSLTEWYVNEPRGLEQGFTVARAPAGTALAAGGLLVLQLRTAGMESRQGLPGESITLVTADGSRRLLYRGLVAWDAQGTRLAAEMWATDGGLRIEVADAGARYPLTIDPLIESTILRASDAQPYDQFASSVAISGDTAIVGAPGENGGPGDPLPGAGAAYIFERDHLDTGNWVQVKKLTASDGQRNDSFGSAVAISGETAIVGAALEDGGPSDPTVEAGAAYVFERNLGGAGNWGEVVRLTGSPAVEYNYFGSGVAISSDTALVGAPGLVGFPGSEAAYVFERNQGGADNWGESKRLTNSDPNVRKEYGYGVAISADTIVVGAAYDDVDPGNPIPGAGAAYVHRRDQGGVNNWGQVAKLTASDPGKSDFFGRSLAISGDTVIVGVAYEDGGPGDPMPVAGAAYVFERNRGGPENWGEVKKLTASDAQEWDYFGGSVAISGDTIIAAAAGEDGGPGDPLAAAGAAYVYERNQGGTGNWGEVAKLMASDAELGDRFGRPAISGDTAIVGAPGESGGPGAFLFQAGAAYIFNRAKWVFVLDAFGGLHAAGTGAVPINPPPPYFGFDIARDAELTVNGAYVLDGFGGLHAAGDEPGLTPGPPYFGFDIARDVELAAGGGAYVLDGLGGVHAAGGAPVLTPATLYLGWDAARDLELSSGGFYVMDSFGGLHPGGGATAMVPAPPYFGFAIARDFELAGDAQGYLLDGHGGVHAAGGAPVLTPMTPYFGFDIARDLELAYGRGHYVLDGLGGLHAGGGAVAISPAPTYFFFDAARDLEIR